MKAHEIIEALGGLASSVAPAGGAADEIENVERLRELVGLIPNPAGAVREYWVSVGHAVWGASGGSEDGYSIFEEWSARWPGGNDPDENRRLWDSILGSGIGRGWLRREAGKADAEGADRWMSGEAKDVFDDGVQHPPPGAAAPAGEAIDPVQRQVADSIVRANGGRLRFNHDSGCWHKFDGCRWKGLPRSVKAGFLLAERWAAANAHLLGPADFKAASKANFYDGVENILRQRLIVRQEDFDADPWLIGTPGGTVDLKTGVLRGALAGDFISKATSVAPALVATCPRWKKFVFEICKGDPAAQVFLQQWFGYCLTGDTSEQIFLFLYGPGGNGKSVLVDTMAWVLGDYFRKPVADLYFKKTGTRHAQEIAMLAGARMVSISEVPSGAAWDESRLKEHTGGGHVTANFMRENAFTFTTQFKLTVQGNHQPTFPGGINPAIQRRFKMMLLDFIPAVVDKRLEVILKAEGAGILRWALEGLCHPSLGWHTVGLMIPASVDSVTDEFVAEQDVFAAWVGTRIEKKPGVGDTKALFDDWIEFRNAQGNSTELYSNVTSFVREMERRGFRRVHLATVRGFRDIALKSKAKEDFDD
jgi:putative DNA primase/helicase